MPPVQFEADSLKLQSPAGVIVSGMSNSGKTSFVLRLLRHASEMFSPPPMSVVFCYGVVDAHVPILEKAGVLTHEGPPTSELLGTQPKPFLLVLDDLMLSMDPTLLSDIFTKRLHHENFSCIFLTQNTFEPRLKVPRTNAAYIVLLRSPSALLGVKTLGSHLFPGKQKEFMAAYDDATSKPYKYLLIDNHPCAHHDLRLRTNIFPDELTMVYKI